MSKITVQCAELQHPRPRATTKLPRGLVGSRCTVEVTITGHNYLCLLDTGSQVATVPTSFYNRHLHDHPILSLHDLLQIEGAAGQSVPYLGYVDLSATFPEDFLGRDIQVSTLALVVPDSSSYSASAVLIGVNMLEPVSTIYV